MAFAVGSYGDASPRPNGADASSPQHATVASPKTAHAWDAPTQSERAPAAPAISTGSGWGALSAGRRPAEKAPDDG